MIFISHRQADSFHAKTLADILKSKGVQYWVDVLDPSAKSATDITKHIIKSIGNCTHMIALFSTNTHGSMWVPFELGAAYIAEKGIGTLLIDHVSIPEYLNAFPRMKTTADLDKFITEYKEDQALTKSRMDDRNVRLGARSNADSFIFRLKSKLGQQ